VPDAIAIPVDASEVGNDADLADHLAVVD